MSSPDAAAAAGSSKQQVGSAPGNKRGTKLELTEGDRVAVYLELIDCMQALNKTVRPFLLFLMAKMISKVLSVRAVRECRSREKRTS